MYRALYHLSPNSSERKVKARKTEHVKGESAPCSKVRSFHAPIYSGFYVGAGFRMKILDGLLCHRLYPDNEITLSLFICAGGNFIYIRHRMWQSETLPKTLLRTKVTSSNPVIT
jgi:hypothetical protein